MKIHTSKFILGIVALLAASAPVAEAQKQWTAGGASQNWSDGSNWSDFSAAGTGEILYFEDLLFSTGFTNRAAAVNNIVAADTTVAAINYTATSLTTNNHFYTTLIPGGVTLTLSGLANVNKAALVAGDVPGALGWLSSGSATNYSTITGAGALLVNDPISLISVGWRNRATLDLSGLNTFNSTNGQIRIGASSDNPNTTAPTGWLILAKTNNITTAPNLTVPGVLMGAGTNGSGSGTLLLGQVNLLNTDTLVVGGRRSTSTLLAFALAYSNSPTTGSLILRSSAGGATPIPVFSIGDAAANIDGFSTAFPGSAASATGIADFSGAAVDILADSIYIGRASAATQVASGTGAGTLIVQNGTITATNVYIGYKPNGATNASIGQGSLVLRSNAVMNVLKDVALVYLTNGTAFMSESRITVSNNAVLNVGGNLTTTRISTGSWTPASVDLNGGTINMTGGGTVFIPTLLANNGGFTGASMVTVTNSLALGAVAAPFKPAAPGTLLVGSNLTLGANMPLAFKLGANTTVGSGVNDLIGVAHNLTLNNNPITVTFTAPLVAGTYLLMTNGGTQSGIATWTNLTRSTAALVQNSTSVGIQVSSLAPANLVMAGSTPATNWGTTNVVWNNNTEKFYQLDNVLFDDTATATNITLAANVTPGSVTVSNNAKAFAFNTSSTGPAWIGGYGTLTKDGTSGLYLNGQNNNFYGAVDIKKGSLRLGFANSGEQFGSAGATNAVTIFNGATLDVANYVGSSSSYGRPYFVAGSGVGGLGAIIGLSTFTAAGITLTGDATIACPTGTRMSVTGVLAPYPYNNVIDLGNHTLTISGNEVRFNQWTITNAGNITVSSASISLQNSIIDGAGTFNLGSKNLNFNSWSTGYVAKAISVSGGSITIATAGTPPILIGSPITMNGSLTITNSQVIRLTNSLTGVGSLAKYGTANLTMEAANSYLGSTLIAAGTLSLTNSGSFSSPSVTINSGATFDATALPGGYTPPTGQTLQIDGTAKGNFITGAGSVIRGIGTINGPLSLAAGGTIAVGTSLVGGTLTVSNDLTLNGGTNTFKFGGPDDLISVVGNLSVTAPVVINISPVGPLTGRHVLYQYTGSMSGVTSNNLVFSSPRPLVFVLDTNTVGQVAVNISGSVTLDWAGGAVSAPTAWNVNTTSNWLNSGTPDIFFPGDTVQFGDGANTNLVSLATTMQPAGVVMNNLTSDYTFTGAGGITAGSLSMNGSSSLTLSNAGNITMTGSGIALSAGTLNFSQTTNTTLTAQLTGSAALVKSGTNRLTVVSVNSSNFTGTVALNVGTLRSGSVNALGASSVTVASGTTLDVNGQVGSLSTVSVSGAGAFGLGAIDNTGASQTNALMSVTLNGNTTLGAISNRWDIAPYDTNGTPGVFNGNNYNLVKTGANDIWFRQLTDTGLGDIDITAGRLIFASVGTLLGNSSSNLVVRTNATLGLVGGIKTPGKNTTIANGGGLYASGGGNQVNGNQFGGNIVNSNALVKLEPNAYLTLGGNMSGPGSLTVQGVNAGNFGILTLTGTNTYTGGTTVNDGELDFTSSNSIPSNTNIVLSSRVAYNLSGHPIVGLLSNTVSPSSVRLDMQTVGSAGAAQAWLIGDGATWSGPIKITGADSHCVAYFQSAMGGLVVAGAVDGSGFSGNSSGNGGIKVSGDNVLVSDVTLGGTGICFNNPLVFNGSFSCNNAGLGGSPGMTKLVLASAGNSWVDMYWNRGIIQIGADNALPQIPITIGTLVAGGDHRDILDLNGHTQTLVNWKETFTGNDASWMGNSSTNANATLVYAGIGTNTWTAYIIDAFDTNAVVQKQTSLNVTAGILKLVGYPFGDPSPSSGSYFPSGPPPYPFGMTYTGPTTITGGTLEVDKYLGVSPVTVSSGGTLSGYGSLGGPLSIASGGTVAPGTNSIGALTVSNNVVFVAGSKGNFRVNLTAGAYDQVVGISNLTYGGTLTITNIGAQVITNGTILPLFSAASYTAGSVAVSPLVPAPGLLWDTSYLATDGTLRVTTVSTNSPTLTSAKAGNSLTLSWPADHGGWRLQVQTNSLSTGINNSWATVPGSTNTLSVTIPIVSGNPTVFYRLIYP